MKNILNSLFVLVAFTFFCIAVRGSIENHNFHMSTVSHDDPMFLDEIIELSEPQKVEPPIVPEIRLANFEDSFAVRPIVRNLTEEEKELLVRISMAEARGEGIEGLALVQLVVLNRCEKTGQTVRQVIFSPNQFFVQGMCAGNEEAYEALKLVCCGWDESQGAIYFAAGGYNRYGTPLFSYNHHYFSK